MGAGDEIHQLSHEIFEVARDFAQAKFAADAAQARMSQLEPRLREAAKRAKSEPAEAQADLDNVLSEASMDLSYVESAGSLPSSKRLGRVLAELKDESW